MPSINEVYKCTHCGNVVEVVHGGKAPLICCGEPMKQMREGQTDGAAEKHVPVIEKTENGYIVKVGSATSPLLNSASRPTMWWPVNTATSTVSGRRNSNEQAYLWRLQLH